MHIYFNPENCIRVFTESILLYLKWKYFSKAENFASKLIMHQPEGKTG